MAHAGELRFHKTRLKSKGVGLLGLDTLIRLEKFYPFPVITVLHRRPFSHKALVNPLVRDWWRRSFIGADMLQYEFWADSRDDS
jgi:hypothetical protein